MHYLCIEGIASNDLLQNIFTFSDFFFFLKGLSTKLCSCLMQETDKEII